MNEKNFLKTMRLIDDDLLEEAYAPVKRKSNRWLAPAAIAACLCLVIGAGAWNMASRGEQPFTIIVSEAGFRMELPDNATNVSHLIVEDECSLTMLEASFCVDEQAYLCRMANTSEPANLAHSDGSAVSMMNWQTSDLSFQYCQQEEADSWVSWYDEQVQTQWCLSCDDPIALLTTAEALVQKLGYSMATAPEDAEQVNYRAVYYQDRTVGETSFVRNGITYAYRMASTMTIEDYFGDISALELSGDEYDAEVLWCPARITIDANGQGKIVWFDLVPGLLYSVTMDSNASEDALLEMALTLFEPAQEPDA